MHVLDVARGAGELAALSCADAGAADAGFDADAGADADAGDGWVPDQMRVAC